MIPVQQSEVCLAFHRFLADPEVFVGVGKKVAQKQKPFSKNYFAQYCIVLYNVFTPTRNTIDFKQTWQ